MTDHTLADRDLVLSILVTRWRKQADEAYLSAIATVDSDPEDSAYREGFADALSAVISDLRAGGLVAG